jgi:2,3-bisphosphoglycerate-dependent phosphoglycerate mutase
MYQLVLLRHGESLWNLENRFTGWVDVPLTPNGITQAQKAGSLLKQKGYHFDMAYTSVLQRAIWTLWHCLDSMQCCWLPTVKDWRLNERHYGALQGLNKLETAKQYGEEQVKLWRRSYSNRPPALTKPCWQEQKNDIRYQGLNAQDIPFSECLKDTIARVVPFWLSNMVPQIKIGKRLLISAHGNSLRAFIKHLEGLNDTEIMKREVPNGVPLVYTLDKNLNPVEHFYLESS